MTYEKLARRLGDAGRNVAVFAARPSFLALGYYLPTNTIV